MRVLTRKRERLLDQLIGVGGSAEAVRRALRELNAEQPHAPTIAAVIRRLLRNRYAVDGRGAACLDVGSAEPMLTTPHG